MFSNDINKTEVAAKYPNSEKTYKQRPPSPVGGSNQIGLFNTDTKRRIVAR